VKLLTVGVGFTVIVKVVAGELVQPLFVPVTEIVAVTGAEPAFTPVNAAMLPVPDADKPIDALVFVQAYVVPVKLFAKVTAVVCEPLHTVWLLTAVIIGEGLTVTFT
jgi:hypothetical protein